MANYKNTSVSEIINKLLLDAKQAQISEENIKEIEKAAKFAELKHFGQFRKSGEPYIIHPLATAKILLSWRMDVETIITGILHDVLEDTPTTEQEIQDNFGVDVLNLVKYVTKVSLLSKENRREHLQKTELENNYIVQVFLSMSEDIRGMIVKLADRYHNMTTIQYLRPDKQKQIASETMDIYAKVAGRLGMYRLKTDLQDLAFEVLNPDEFIATKNRINLIVEVNNSQWHAMIEQIKHILDSYSIEYEIKERLKGIYSTWEKITKNYAIKEIHDIYAIRIIVNDNLECYKVLGLIHLNFKFLKNAFKDYISSPKLNSYQSIHTTILKNQALLEVQIRTSEMDAMAENGIAAHWNYKDKIPHHKSLDQSFHLISEISNLSNKTVDDIKRLTNDIVFDVLVLNNESKYVVNNRTRAIDLAYRVDKEQFKYLATIMVNGQQVSFDTLLKQNDVVKINYSKNILINHKWAKFTQFNTTKDGINKIIEEQYHNQIIDVKKFLLKLKNSLKNNYIGDNKVAFLIKKKLKINSIEDFLDFITIEVYDDPHLIKCFDKHKTIARRGFSWLLKKYGGLLKSKKEFYFNNIDGLYFEDLSFPNCCNKIPHMDVVGKIITKNNILEVHNRECEYAKKGQFKVYPLVWNDELLRNRPRKFRYKLSFTADWTPSIGNIISKKIISFHLVINELQIQKNKQNDTCNVSVTLYASELQHIKSWFAELSQEINIKNNLVF